MPAPLVQSAVVIQPLFMRPCRYTTKARHLLKASFSFSAASATGLFGGTGCEDSNPRKCIGSLVLVMCACACTKQRAHRSTCKRLNSGLGCPKFMHCKDTAPQPAPMRTVATARSAPCAAGLNRVTVASSGTGPSTRPSTHLSYCSAARHCFCAGWRAVQGPGPHMRAA